MRSIGYLTLTALLLTTALPSGVAHAQADVRKVNAQSFEPTTDPNGVLTADSAATQRHLAWHAGLYFSYVNDPLTAFQDRDVLYRYVHHQVMLDLVASIGIWRYFELGLHVPFALYQDSDGDEALVGGSVPGLKGAAVGDIRLVPKVRFWRNKPYGFGLALIPQISFFTMRDTNLSDGGVSFEPKVVLDYRFKQGALIALNVGVRIRKGVQVNNLRVDDELFYALAAEVPVWRRLSVLGELKGAVGFRDAAGDSDGGIDTEEAPLETLLGARYRFDFGLIVTGGVGVGLTRGYGTPDFRVFLGVGYAVPARTTAKPGDRDGDGILDKDDKCADAPEDKDGFEDKDGCPDPDNDKDGVCDPEPEIQENLKDHESQCKGRDKAPNAPEDKDGFDDHDGEPDPDNDKDGLCDPHEAIQKNLERYQDQCKGKDLAPLDPEDRDGFEDDDGKPDPDNDGDGVCDDNEVIQKKLAQYQGRCKGKDLAPNEAEDKDGFADEDGKPDPDNDGDGFCDSNDAIQKNAARYARVCKGKDKCPNKKEIINGVKDDDGCPDKGRSKVTVSRKKIVILDKVYFQTGSHVIMRKSYSLLRQVAVTMKTYVWIEKVRIEGHTDDRGKDAVNLNLSQRRANSVRQLLIRQGVAAKRLVAKGYGETKPIRSGCAQLGSLKEKQTCWAKNRRVTFKIIKTSRDSKAGTTVKTR